MFEKVVPLKLYLHILQLEGYKYQRFLVWLIKNLWKRKVEGKKPLGWSAKARFLYWVSWGISGVVLISYWPAGLVLLLQPWIPLLLALAILKPYEVVRLHLTKRWVLQRIRILKQKGLKVIGVTGSYGKTSTKEFLYQILKTKYQVLRTPESFNTVFGITKVVEWELDDSYDYFICEMGAYKIGEIAELCEMVLPDFGILTGINEQHLERFGGIANTIKAKFELVDDVLSRGGKVVANIGNHLVQANLRGPENGYGQVYFTHPQKQNIEGAATMAKILGLSDSEIKKAIGQIELPSHRLSLIKRGDLVIIDDAYSSNVDGFKAAVGYLKSFPGWKVIVTPGITELGEETSQIHQELGKLMSGLDQVILVGRNERTENLAKGFGKPVIFVEKVGEALARVAKTKATVLFENDLPDNY